jgi:hypothetical protein
LLQRGRVGGAEVWTLAESAAVDRRDAFLLKKLGHEILVAGGLIARSRSSGCNLNAFSSRVGTMTGSPPVIGAMCW